MSRSLLSFAGALLLGLAVPLSAQPAGEQQSLLGLRALDAQVATIGHRLAVGSIDLCAERQWLPGFAVHDLSQYGGAYREAAIRAFGLDRGPGVLALARGGPAERAGLRQDDVLISADGMALVTVSNERGRTFDQTEHILDLLDQAFADGRAEFEVLRGPERLRLAVGADRGCASRFQVVPSRRLNARADGRYVQVTTAIAEYVQDDQELAAVLAHEFAHNVLRHRIRLDQAGIARGFLGNFGRNARLIRETEAEADRMSVYLLDRAGFDMTAPIRFWSRFGRRGLSFLSAPTHPNWRQRILLFEAEVARIREAHNAGDRPAPPPALVQGT